MWIICMKVPKSSTLSQGLSRVLSKPISMPSLFVDQEPLDTSKTLFSSSQPSTLSSPQLLVRPTSIMTLIPTKPCICFSSLTIFRDSMMRDGKRSISRDLVRFLEFIDGVVVKRHGLSLKTMKNMNFGHPNCNKGKGLGIKIRSLSGQREVIQKLRARVKKISGFFRQSNMFKEEHEDY
ncbi:hypothetical protein SO802_023147 [Lithocarpus litseifolius]|uniref:Uncharacterized protein n=1 Tax=Lithocarpus litseifolius TaxID=425828 RepID=A0AAW2C5H2_9ROSI